MSVHVDSFLCQKRYSKMEDIFVAGILRIGTSMAKTNMEVYETREEKYNRLGNCEVCGSIDSRYTCPRCELKTCSLNCVDIHKKELECNGERDKTGYVPLSKFTNLTLLSDYRFLEDVTRAIDACKRNPLKKYTRFRRPLPPHLWKLRSTALKRKTTLHFLPQHFTRHKENTSHLNFKSGIIFWKVEVIFPQGDNIKVTLEKCNENDRLSLVLSQLIEYEKCSDLYKNHLKFYHSAGLAAIEVLLKAENVKGSDSFFLLDTSLSMKENFENRIIIENPILYVILKDHKDEYKILDSDLEVEFNLNQGDGDGKKCNLFHYFDVISYTDGKVTGDGDKAVHSIHSSIKELKKYFAAGDSDESEEETVAAQKEVKRKELNIPDYEDLIAQGDKGH